VDKLDQQILRILTENARIHAAEISRQVNLSVSAVIDRIHRLEEHGVITGYTAMVDHSKLGYGICAWLHVQLNNPKLANSFAARMQHMPGLLRCDYLTGEFDFLLQAVTRNTKELDQLHRAVSDMEGVATVRTHVVLNKIECNGKVIADI